MKTNVTRIFAFLVVSLLLAAPVQAGTPGTNGKAAPGTHGNGFVNGILAHAYNVVPDMIKDLFIPPPPPPPPPEDPPPPPPPI